jgi:putative ABC transport system permease protein
MLANYFKIALRTLLRSKTYSFVNIAGLALGLATCLLIALYVTDELSYENFHLNKDRIYRVVGGQTLNNIPSYTLALMPPPLAMELKIAYPEVEAVTRFGTTAAELKYKNIAIPGNEANQGLQMDDGAFFRIFSFVTLVGNAEITFNGKANNILTRSMAMRLFGNISDAVGKTITFSGQPVNVSAVIEDVPRTSHLRFEYIVPMEIPSETNVWENNYLLTYILLKQGTDWRSFNEKVKAIGQKYIAPALKKYNPNFGWTQELQPLSDIRLFSNLTTEKGTTTRVQIFGWVGVLVLLLACINYANLSTARSMLRSREVGVRKTFGATRFQVMLQFLGEAFGLIVIAFLLAAALVELALPFFNTLSGKHFVQTDVFQSHFLIVAAGIFMLTVSVSGGYAAFVLSAFRPAEALKTSLVSGKQRGGLRRVLVVGQFVISTALIIGVWVINEQLRYMNTASLGFNKQQLVATFLDKKLYDKQELALTELRRIPGVEAAGVTNQCPVIWTGAATLDVQGKRTAEPYTIKSDLHLVGYDFQNVMEIPLLQGRFYESGRDSGYSVVVNESFVKAMGWENPIGQELRFTWDSKMEMLQVIGVVANFHSKSFHSPVTPTMYLAKKRAVVLLVRLKMENIQSTLAQIAKTYNSFKPEYPPDFKFLDEEFAKFYADDENLGQTLAAITFIAIVIASLGLFGLATFAAERRTKEIGIRKVLGASVASIIALLSKDFLKLVALAIAIATPLAYWAAGKWLQDFAYKIDLSAWIFVASATLAIVIAFGTIASQAWRAARANPVNALRSE